MRSIRSCICAAVLAFPLGASSFTTPVSLVSSQRTLQCDVPTIRQQTARHLFGAKKPPANLEDRTYPEAKPATYDLQAGEFGFGPENIIRPLLKQTQLEKRKLKVVYNAKKDGWDARKFHQMVDGKGASVVLIKVRGQWIGGYNPRGWASLGGSRPSVASFLFYSKLFGGWQKLRVAPGGGMACGRDEFDVGVYFGSDALVMPLNGQQPRSVASRLGYFFESGPENRPTLLPVKGANTNASELYVISGVYAKGEDIPNSGGVTDLGLY